MSFLGDRLALGNEVLQQAVERFGGDHGLLLELEETTGGLRELARFGDVDPMLDQDIRIFAQLAADRPLDDDVILVAPVADQVQKLAARKSVRRGMTASVAVFPLVEGDRAMGAIYLGGHSPGVLRTGDFDKPALRVFGSVMGKILGVERSLSRLVRQNRALQDELKQDISFASLIGRSEALERVRRALSLVAETDIVVTLLGEPGSGKELAAKALHSKSPRHENRFRQLDLKGVTEAMMEEVLFGAEPNAGSTASGRRGAIREAKKGTLLLQHVDRLPQNLQAKLGEAIDRAETMKLGGAEPYAIDVRFILSLEGNPTELQSKGVISHDFFRKLNLYPVLMPPLRDRVEDLPLLIEHFVEEASRAFGKTVLGVDTDVYDHIGTYSWPGNLEELESEMRKAVLRTPDQGTLKVGALGPKLVGKTQTALTDSGQGTLKQRVASVEKRLIIEVLEKNNHNQSVTADQLGLSRQALINKLQRYGIETGRAYKRKRREIAKQAGK
ncbi:MAG: sigma 54-interacting transcriptional regulator [bacterium]